MAVFKYRMQNVLDIKQKLEESAKMEFGEANARVAREEDKLSAIEDRKRAYEAVGEKLRKQQLHVREIKSNVQAIAVLGGMVKEQEREVEKAKVIQEEKRKQLQEAMQERKIQEKLKENQFEEFIRDEYAKESKEVDELVSYVYGKRSKEEA